MAVTHDGNSFSTNAGKLANRLKREGAKVRRTVIL